MNHTTSDLVRQNLRQTAHYARAVLNLIEPGAGAFPQWVADYIAQARVYISEAGHFLRDEASQGRRYGNHPESYAYPKEKERVAYMVHANLHLIEQYAEEILGLLVLGAGDLDPMVLQAISNTAFIMDKVAHFVEVQAQHGRRYGVPGFVYCEPGWAGQAGVQPGGRAGLMRGGDPLPHNYGSMGYGSMGIGSMDMATAPHIMTRRRRKMLRRRGAKF